MHIRFTGLQLKNIAVEKTDVVKPNRRWNMDFLTVYMCVV